MPSVSHPRPLRQSGFTLIELLVTIVILGFVIGVMSSAFTQVAQILRVAAESGGGFQERWLRTRALQELVSNLVLTEHSSSRLTGTADAFDCLTLASPLAAPGAPQRVHVTLEPVSLPDGRTGTDLSVRTVDRVGTKSQEAATRWVRWPGSLRFSYIDRAGKEYVSWPPAENRADELPSELLVRPAADDKVLVRTAIFEGALYKPKAANLKALQDFLGFAR
ncbi:prepilin-type N-terminal cleavage/methylation domain-containing protein [Variovorax sp. J22P271]|uniref:type II secretion system protein n=1 Tax=Variovorax davisae TaxID=3053515 RepID=UPI002578DEBB|nr:prepilin-type N-terminal cleavage/methylation domain-containing protein [Variovorax sp. J22P271]MDM0033333.1 prepilin-type N-terminal cleavage/methylation domain-containing protein [Variovorax sp. J22P271]